MDQPVRGSSLSVSPRITTLSCSRISSGPRPRVEDHIDQIAGRIHKDDQNRSDHYYPQDPRVVLPLQPLVEEPSHTGPGEYRLCYDRPGEEGGDLHREDRHGGKDRAAQGVLENDCPLVESLGPCGPDVAATERIYEPRPDAGLSAGSSSGGANRQW